MRPSTRFSLVAAGALAAAAAFLSSAASAEPILAQLDPSQSVVRFTLDATLHTVHGSVRVASGELHADTREPGATGEVVLDMTSAETGIARRDRKMEGTVLHAEKNPQAVFTIERMTGALVIGGESDVLLEGRLVLAGGEHPFSIPLHAAARDGRFTARGQATVPYVEWGLSDPSFFVLRVAKQVSVEIQAAGTYALPESR